MGLVCVQTGFVCVSDSIVHCLVVRPYSQLNQCISGKMVRNILLGKCRSHIRSVHFLSTRSEESIRRECQKLCPCPYNIHLPLSLLSVCLSLSLSVFLSLVCLSMVSMSVCLSFPLSLSFTFSSFFSSYYCLSPKSVQQLQNLLVPNQHPCC